MVAFQVLAPACSQPLPKLTKGQAQDFSEAKDGIVAVQNPEPTSLAEL